MEYYATLETGGTKCVCAIGNGPEDIMDISTFPTETPESSIPKIIEYFQSRISKYNITKMGITSFGPIDPNPNSPHYGYITTTPKLPWAHFDLVGTMKKALKIEDIAFDTDVNGAALAEGAWGAAKGLDTFVYITVGTGIGVGVVSNNETLHGMLHPESGHMLLPLHPQDPSEGFCPYHKSCLEGLAAGPTFDSRWNKPAAEIPDEHIAWEIETYYLALGLCNLVYTVSPQRIVMGGGISKRRSIFPRIQKKVQELLNGYIATNEIISNIEKYIVPPVLEHSGLLGGLVMASRL